MGLDSQSSRALPEEDRPHLYGIRGALFLALLSVGAVVVLSSLGDKQWRNSHPGGNGLIAPDPLWVAILWFALPVIPYLSSGLLLSARNEEFLALGAGVAGALFGFAFLFGLSVLGSITFLNFSPGPYDAPIGIVTLLFLVCCIWIFISAFRIGTLSWGPFWVGVVLTLVSMAWANHALEETVRRLDREYQQKQAEANSGRFVIGPDPRRNIVYLASCLLMTHAWRPAPFPNSLSPWPDVPCDARFSETMVPNFSLSYTPHVDPISEKIFDFQLVALPRNKGIRNQSPLMVDRRGIVFVQPAWSINQNDRRITVFSSDWTSSKIDGLRKKIEAHMRETPGGLAPAQLSPDIRGDFQYNTLSSDTSGTTLEVTNFVIRYLAPRTDAPNQFAISVQCQSYGDKCLRSYLLDYDGRIRATGEPRQATSNDPPALECEIMPSECQDVRWSLP